MIRSFHVMAKPVGPLCNLDCQYCFYQEKERLFPKRERFRIADETLEAFIRQYIQLQTTPEIHFIWQGGEPTLLGIDFFRKAISIQKQYADGRPIRNAIQTNGTLLDDEWCRFLSEHDFLVGISLDGPAHLHDRYRVDKQGHPTFAAVMRGIEALKRQGTAFNTLTVVNRLNADHPLEVYRFLKEIGSGFIQFIPLVERKADRAARDLNLTLAAPPALDAGSGAAAPVTPWSVTPRQYGEFLVTIFDEWIRRDVGKVCVQTFEVALGNWMGMGSGLCVFAPRCGTAMAMEHNGDVYACDHYVYPDYRLGNVLQHSLVELLSSPQQRKFANDKFDALPKRCRNCEVRFACHGECPKNRFIETADGDPGLNYLCTAYRRFFNHIDPYMQRMAHLLRTGRSTTLIMDWVARRDHEQCLSRAKRNDPCPCLSGKKYKNCCAAARPAHRH
ncbi:MAG TPA: anaerobic sulfatase-maturation protein [Candidatus Competibacteraceae bacterium]|nr:anaerobic sulfatase-maturation protein [Candidatus Competibacteraceae bacterium]